MVTLRVFGLTHHLVAGFQVKVGGNRPTNLVDEKLWKCKWEGDILYSHSDNHGNWVVIVLKNLLNTKNNYLC